MISSHQAHPLTDDAIPVTLGHEISGTVDEVGADVADFRTGDTVFVMANLFYETCEACRGGRMYMCQKLGIIGYSSARS